MTLTIIPHPSPNFDERLRAIDLVVLHYTGMQSADAALARLCDPLPKAGAYPGPWQSPETDPGLDLAKVSCHYVVDEAGRIFQLVAEENRAWHAGLSAWGGVEAVNHNSIGIEIANGGHDFGLPPYPDAQITAVIALVGEIAGRWRLGPHRIVGHSDVAPGRKEDPGEHFPWRRLATAGLALWPLTPPAPGGPVIAKPGDQGEAVLAIQETLAAIGYGLAATGYFDAMTENCVVAFQRRFRTLGITGAVDDETAGLMADIAGQTARLVMRRMQS